MDGGGGGGGGDDDDATAAPQSKRRRGEENNSGGRWRGGFHRDLAGGRLSPGHFHGGFEVGGA